MAGIPHIDFRIAVVSPSAHVARQDSPALPPALVLGPIGRANVDLHGGEQVTVGKMIPDQVASGVTHAPSLANALRPTTPGSHPIHVSRSICPRDRPTRDRRTSDRTSQVLAQREGP